MFGSSGSEPFERKQAANVTKRGALGGFACHAGLALANVCTFAEEHAHVFE
ncbi:MAG TPA: hypothetical protein VGG74_03955 [Kofleriaceae bacterium]